MEDEKLDTIDKMKAEAVETILIGIVSKHMGYVKPSQPIGAGKEVFEYIKRLTYKQFSDIKKLNQSDK
jgi:hypothetical protein